tara:strand:+ start:261 stop:887 length:627 start_codon:yes stop_codon:yes gene_type:complete
MAIVNKSKATAIAGSLSNPSKMPGKAYGLPAEKCQVGQRLAKVPGTVCSGCYAMKGFYQAYARTVKPAQYKRLDAVLHEPSWVEAMVLLIGADSEFRWHDSGDIQSVAHLRRIALVAEQTPGTAHWIPTREYRYVEQYRSIYGEPPVNLVVRLSAHKLGGPAPVTDLPTSTVVTDGSETCPASKQENKCGPCRACWDPKVKNVAYKAH